MNVSGGWFVFYRTMTGMCRGGMTDVRVDQGGLIRAEVPKRTLDDLVVTPAVRMRIDNALAMVEQRRILIEEWGFTDGAGEAGALALNLYGPSGTGKTLCAEAIAGTLQKRLLRVNYAELESRFMGETSKNVVEAFRRARSSEAVLFFDEADSVLRRRFAQVTQGSEHVVNITRSVLFVELERFEGIVIFATNMIEGYDPAFSRRIVAHIEFELPDASCRQILWGRLIPERAPRSPDLTASWLASLSEGLSGGDLQKTALRAACRAVRRPMDHRLLTQDDFIEELALARITKEKVVPYYGE
jgi:ATP-dependent 26S proteasome regulatory subunit